MSISSSGERPDLYDGHDGRSYAPTTVEYLMAITPEHVKAAIEAKQGKPFQEVAQDMARESWRRASIYHRHFDGEIYRVLPGRAVERFDQASGRFGPCELPLDEVRRTVPMTFEEARPLMKTAPLLDPLDPNLGV